ncbi:MAG: glycogen-binding domain-containing protein [Candidatus Omnitrophica bacterium]|nr:glycogen-binding domain-containing protein [Candidatus Omnitrophota bacterium]
MARIAGKEKEFKIYAPDAKKVSIAGSFNNWDAKKNTAKKDSKGNWSVKLSLKPGRHEYKFVVDGNWTSDPACNNCVPNGMGGCNCTVDIK